MISQCCVCKKIYGVKCPKCALVVIEGTLPEHVAAVTYTCGNNHIFMGERGGISHGYCTFCQKAEMDRFMLPLALDLYKQ